MSWQLLIYDHLPQVGGTLENTITNGAISSGEVCVSGSPVAVLDEYGRTESISFSGRQDLIGATARKTVLFKVDGNDVAAGVVVVCPPAGTMGKGPFDGDHLGNFECEGHELLVSETNAVNRLFPDFDTVTVLSQDIAKVAQRIAQFSAPGVGTDVANFPDVAEIMPGFYSPERPLNEVLDVLAKTVTPDGARWWVDALGDMHFEKIV